MSDGDIGQWPPLPEPEETEIEFHKDWNGICVQNYYTEKQMREYAETCVAAAQHKIDTAYELRDEAVAMIDRAVMVERNAVIALVTQFRNVERDESVILALDALLYAMRVRFTPGQGS